MVSVPGTHCRSKRHELTPENTYITSIGARSCRACQREAKAAPAPVARECAACGEHFLPRNRDVRYIYCSRTCNERVQQMRRYGLTVADYRTMLEDQAGVCAICGEVGGRRGLAVDHDHVTGKVRGLLCGWCNPGLGNFRDTPARLRAAANYLESRSS